MPMFEMIHVECDRCDDFFDAKANWGEEACQAAETAGWELHPGTLCSNCKDDLKPCEEKNRSKSTEGRYRYLVDEIRRTMGEPDKWGGEESEEETLIQYVRWLAGVRKSLLEIAGSLDGDNRTISPADLREWVEGIS